jgi:hypothetical protein
MIDQHKGSLYYRVKIGGNCHESGDIDLQGAWNVSFLFTLDYGETRAD